MYCSFVETYTKQLNHSNRCARPPVTGFFKRSKGFIPICRVLPPQRPRSLCGKLMTTVVSLSCATGCAWRCTCHRNPRTYPQFLTLCICLFTSGKPMTCTHGWMSATPLSAMQSLQVGPAAFSRLHQHFPLFRKSRRRYVRCYSTFRLPLNLSRIFMTPPGTRGTVTPVVHSRFRSSLPVSINFAPYIYPSFATTLTRRRSMWPGFSCNLVFPVRQRGGAPLGPSRIRGPTSLRRKVGMMATAPLYPLYFSVARACPASGKSHAICTLISGPISWMKC